MTRTLLLALVCAHQVMAGEPRERHLRGATEAMTRPPVSIGSPSCRSGADGADSSSVSSRAGWWKRHLADTALHVGWASADMLSSRGMYELNPVLGRGPFGTRQVAISASIVGGIELTKWVLARRYPRSRVVRAMSLVPAALRGGVAARNWRVR